METSPIEHVLEFPLTFKELATLNEDVASFFVLVNYAATEINVFSRLALFSSAVLTDEQAINCAAIAQNYTILRCWSAKIFEFSKSLEQVQNNSKIDPQVKKLAQTALEQFDDLKKDRSFFIVRNIRDEVTNHYSYKSIKKNLPFVNQSANCNLYLHEKTGNSYSLVGDEVVFSGRLNRHYSTNRHTHDRAYVLKNWSDWNIKAGKWVHSVYHQTNSEILSRYFRAKKPRRLALWLKKHDIGDQNSRIPIFFRRRDPG